MCIYNHKTCQKILSEAKKPITGVGCLIINKYNKRDRNKKIISSVPVVYFIKERFGVAAHTYSIIGGRLNKGEDCYISAMLRELKEEAKVAIPLKNYSKYFKDRHNNTRYIWYNGTPIFIGLIKGISRTIIRTIIAQDNANPRIDKSYKETSDIECIRLDNMRTLDGKTLTLSPYAQGVLDKNDLTRFL